MKIKRNAIVAQSGGPSCAINATLAGVLAACAGDSRIGKVYGARHGIEGVLKDSLIDLTDFRAFEKLKATPAMALGSCRCKLPPLGDKDAPAYTQIMGIFEKYEIGYFFYIGGNDSMDTVRKLAALFEGREDAPRVMGLPKTIDNDLPLTDHTPGFGSAAKYLSVTLGEIIRDTAIYAVPAVTIVEVMGRNAGWLTLAAALPRLAGGEKPDIIAIPEVPFDEENFLREVRGTQARVPSVVAVVSEGIKDMQGDYVGSSTKSGAVDVFGHAYLSGVGKYLEGLVKREIGCKVRSIELNLMQRCSAHLASAADVEEGFAAGREGVARALQGETGKMVALIRNALEPYSLSYETVPVERVANLEQLVPEKWRDVRNPQVQKELCAYLLPLIRGDVARFENEFGLPEYVVFE